MWKRFYGYTPAHLLAMAQPGTDIVIALTTVPSDLDVDELVRKLLERRLVACANVLPPMRSTYWWKGTIEMSEERQVVFKTRRGCIAELEVALREVHPFEVPEFLVVPVSGGGAGYLRWVKEETGGRAEG